jgi:hypothetical protein
VMDVRTVLERHFSGGGRWARVGLWMIPMLALQAAPAIAQESQPDSQEQPSPAAQQSNPSPPTTPAPEAQEEPSTPGDLEELLREEVPAASVGSFGYRLRRYGITPYIHGVLTADLWRWRKQASDSPEYNGFDLRDAHLYFGADILDLVVPELFMEFEPSDPGAQGGGLFLRYAQIDFRLRRELLVMRSGLFLVPFGNYNMEAIPRFITKLPDRPEFFLQIIPTSWQEVGVQLFGKWEWAPGLSMSYAVYVTNGSEQPDGAEGGSLEELENVFEEGHNSDKSIGARFRAELIAGLSVGLSGYTGAYTEDGNRRLSMAGLDLSFYRGPFSLDAEAAFAHQEVTGGALRKWGYAAVAAYRVHPMIEPVLAIDEIHLDGAPEENLRTFWGGLNVYPLPDQVPTAVFKGAYSASVPGGGEAARHKLSVQLAVGF